MPVRDMAGVAPHRSASLMKAQEHLARTLAAGLGRQSSAARALVELDERRSHGERVTICPSQGEWHIVPA